ncbi:sigma factor-like helix-turn-helix DNA-binding protein [Azospirillum sp. sgz301742]
MATLKEFEEALKAAGNTTALDILETLRERDRVNRSIRPARRLTGRKMTPELASEILYLHRTTEMTQQEIAFHLGVNQGRVNEVIKRGKWLDGDPASAEAVARDKAVERAKAGVGVRPRRKPPGKPPGKPADGASAVAGKPPAKKKVRAPGAPVQLPFEGL